MRAHYRSAFAVPSGFCVATPAPAAARAGKAPAVQGRQGAAPSHPAETPASATAPRAQAA